MPINKVVPQLQYDVPNFVGLCNAHWPFLKGLNPFISPDAIRICADISPETRWVIRPAFGDQDYRKDALGWCDSVQPWLDPMLKTGKVWAVEHINEPGFRDANNYTDSSDDAKYMRDHAYRTYQLFRQRGVDRVILYNFSTGVPKVGHWDGPLSVWHILAQAWANKGDSEARVGAIVGSHEYSARRMQDGLGAYCFRFPYAINDIIEAGYPVPPWAITECGIDGGVIAGQGGHGYKSYTTVDDYVDNQLGWYADGLAQYDVPQVATIFIYGGTGEWSDFDLARLETDQAKIIAFARRAADPTRVTGLPAIRTAPQRNTMRAPFDIDPDPGHIVISEFGSNAPGTNYSQYGFPGHNGRDLYPSNYQRDNMPVRSLMDGLVTVAGVRAGYEALGNVVIVCDDRRRLALWLCHLNSVAVTAGQQIKRGDPVGIMGYTGNVLPFGVDGTHLHLGARRYSLDANGDRIVIDPGDGYRGWIDPRPIQEALDYEYRTPTPPPTPVGDKMATSAGIKAHIFALTQKASDLDLGVPVDGEIYWDETINGITTSYVQRTFQYGTLVCRVGDWDNIELRSNRDGAPLTQRDPTTVERLLAEIRDLIKALGNIAPPATKLDADWNDELAQVGAHFEPLPGAKYHLTGVVTVAARSAFNAVSVYKASGLPAVGVQVLNMRPDGLGEVAPVDNSGRTQFNYAAQSAFSNPGEGPFTVWIAQGASKNEETKVVSTGTALSGKVVSLGDFLAEHREIYLQFAEVVVK